MTAAFIVEGKMEKLIIQSLCTGSRVQMINNGSDVTMEVMAKQIASHVRLLRGKHFPIIIIFDRERRTETTHEIKSLILHTLKKDAIDCDSIRIVVADRTIENWILAGTNEIPVSTDYCSKGMEGRSIVGLFRKELSQIGIEYHKTTSGVLLFRKIDRQKAANASASFRDLCNNTSDICFWTRGIF